MTREIHMSTHRTITHPHTNINEYNFYTTLEHTIIIEIYTYKHSLAYLKNMIEEIKGNYLRTVKNYKKNN